MEWLVSVFASSGFGAVIGLFGGILQKKIELKAENAKMNYELKRRELDLKESAQERGHEIDMANKNIERAQVEGQIQVESLEVGAFTESQKNGKADGVLRFFRPLCTSYLLISSTWLFAAVWAAVDGLSSIPKPDLVVMLLLMVNATIFLTTTCVSWWFGSRGGNIGKQK